MKNRYLIILMLVCFAIATLIIGCNSLPDTHNSDDASMTKYYTKEDFNTIIINESTLKDVCDIAPFGPMQATSYGGVCEFPMQNGGCVRIKFYGENLVVLSIEEILAEDMGANKVLFTD